MKPMKYFNNHLNSFALVSEYCLSLLGVTGSSNCSLWAKVENNSSESDRKQRGKNWVYQNVNIKSCEQDRILSTFSASIIDQVRLLVALKHYYEMIRLKYSYNRRQQHFEK